MGKIQVRSLQWWAESANPGWDRVKVSENLGATKVALVAPADTSLKHNRMIGSSVVLAGVVDAQTYYATRDASTYDQLQLAQKV